MKETMAFIIIGLVVAGAIQFLYVAFRFFREWYLKSRKRITVGVYYIRWNPFWKTWQCYYMDGYPAEEFDTLEEAVNHCRRGQRGCPVMKVH